MGETAENTIILLPQLSRIDELCAALMIACADKARTSIYAGGRSYPKLYQDFLQPEGVKFLAQQDINKQIELSLSLSPDGASVKNIRWDSSQDELKIFVELEDAASGQQTLEGSSISARQVGFEQIISFASAAEEIEDYDALKSSGRLFGGRLIKLNGSNPILDSYKFLAGKAGSGEAFEMNTEVSKYYEIGLKYHHSYKVNRVGLQNLSSDSADQGQMYRTTAKQVETLQKFWAGELVLAREDLIWELFALIMLTPTFNPLLQQAAAGAGVRYSCKSDTGLTLSAGKSLPSPQTRGIVLQRQYPEYSLVVSKGEGKVGAQTLPPQPTSVQLPPQQQPGVILQETEPVTEPASNLAQNPVPVDSQNTSHKQTQNPWEKPSQNSGSDSAQKVNKKPHQQQHFRSKKNRKRAGRQPTAYRPADKSGDKSPVASAAENYPQSKENSSYIPLAPAKSSN